MEPTPETPIVPAYPPPVASALVQDAPSPIDLRTQTASPVETVPITIMPMSAPKTAGLSPAETVASGVHSHAGYVLLSIALFVIGLSAGAGGGYYYAQLSAPVAQPIVTEQTPPVPDQTTPADTGTDVTGAAAIDASSTNPLEQVRTNPFQ